MGSGNKLKILENLDIAHVNKKNKRTRRRADNQMIDEAESDIDQQTGKMRCGDKCTGPITLFAVEIRQWPADGRCALNAGDFRLN